MHRTEADLKSLQRAGFVCAVWVCALTAGCRSFYDPPRGVATHPFSGAPVAAPPVAVAPLPPPGAIPVAAPAVALPAASPLALPSPPLGSGPPIIAAPAVPPPVAAPPIAAHPPMLSAPVANPALAPTLPAIQGVPPVVVGAPQSGVAVPPGGLGPSVLPPNQRWVLTLTPTRMVAPVGGEVMLFAGLQTADGRPLVNERLEWMISPDSVGQFLSLSNDGKHFVMPRWCEVPRKVTNSYAVGSTAASPVSLSRAPEIGRGQSWISVTSPTDGTSYVTVLAPNTPGQVRQRQTAVIHWVDSQFSFPAPVIGAVGTRQTFTTIVTRQSDGSPLENWIVRYEVTGGAPAGFAPTGAASIETTTDAAGRATVEVFQPQTQRGTSQINVEVIRPAAPGTSDRRLTIGRNCTTVTWTAADLGMRVSGPAQAEIGATATYRIELVNSGELAVSGIQVQAPLPAGTQFVKSSMPPQATPASLQWRIERVEPRQTVAIDVDLTVQRGGPLEFCAMISAQGGLQGRDCVTTNVAASGGLQVRVSGPQNATVGEKVTFRITVTNNSDVAVDNVLLVDTFDPGLKHTAADRRIELPLGRFAARQTREDVGVTFQVVQPGRHCQRLEVSAPGARGAATEACLTAAGAAGPALVAPGPLPAAPAAPLSPGLEVRKEGPRKMKAGQTEIFNLTLRNIGGTVLRNVRVVDKFERGLTPTRASQGYKIENGDLTWTYATLQPGEVQQLQVAAQAMADALRACTRATISTDGGLVQMDETCVEIEGGAAPAAPPPAPAPAGPEIPPADAPARPAPAAEPGGLAVELTETQDEVPVGRNVTYVVQIRNTRKTSDYQVVLSVVVPPGMSPLPMRPVAPTGATVTGQAIRFGAVAEIRPNEVLPFRFTTRADRAGTMRLEVSVTSRNEVQPIVASEETTVFSEN